MLETLIEILFATAVILVIFFYGRYVLFRLLDRLNLKTEKQDIIAFIIFAAFISLYPAFLSKWSAKLLVKLGIFGWIVAIAMYIVCYRRFKRQVQHRNIAKKYALEKK